MHVCTFNITSSQTADFAIIVFKSLSIMLDAHAYIPTMVKIVLSIIYWSLLITHTTYTAYNYVFV